MVIDDFKFHGELITAFWTTHNYAKIASLGRMMSFSLCTSKSFPNIESRTSKLVNLERKMHTTTYQEIRLDSFLKLWGCLSWWDDTSFWTFIIENEPDTVKEKSKNLVSIRRKK